ncbi:hypothetical protein PMAC_002102 [Pneumocystis sp. 'macacae']|nr:hypothetical protein PMAC_002102 [Pneumocystis sp. 'macacae']
METLRDYVIMFSQSHKNFRREELESLAAAESISLDLSGYDKQSPYLFLRLSDDNQAKRLISYSICSRAIYELWGTATSYADLHSQLRNSGPALSQPFRNASFKFVVESVNKSHTMQHQIEIIDSFSYLSLEGPVSMNNPEQIYAVLEEWQIDTQTLLRVFLGRQLACSSRYLVGRFDLKKRRYIGNTSMDAELSLIAANQALARKGKLVYDPFVGTGSFLFACAYYGAMTMGSDIDGRPLRGRGCLSIFSNLEQYNLISEFLDVFIMDFANLGLRSDFLFDAIICDRNYGVRAGAKTLRKNISNKSPLRDESGCYYHLQKDYIPPTKSYPFEILIMDLMRFASNHLLTQGRLVFWMPSITEDEANIDMPYHPNLLLVANSLQCFGKWSRRLLTYVRKDRILFNEDVVLEKIENKFREKYFMSKNK